MKTKSLLNTLSIAFILFTINVSGAAWTSISPIYAGLLANDGAVSFFIGNKGYICAGSSVSDLYVYDTLANSWSIFGSVPSNMGHAFAMSFVLNDKAYIIGGDTGGVPLRTVWEFDPSSSNPWTQKNNFTGGVRDAGFAFAINNTGYVGAGFDGANMYNDVWKYNQANDSWAPVGYLNVNGLIFPTSFAIGNKGYVVTGGTSPSGVNEVKKMFCIDGTTDSISAKADFPGAGRQAAFAFSNNYFGFVGGGQAGYITNYYDMYMYDPGNNQWTPQPDAPVLGAAWSSTFVIGNIAYLGLGAKFQGTGLTGTDAFYKFSMDISTGMHTIVSNNLSMYPNPATNYISLPAETERGSVVKIFNATGQIIKEQNLDDPNLFIGDLKTGIYTVHVVNKTSTIIGRLVKE